MTVQLRELYEKMAPADIRNNEKVAALLEEMGMKGTNYDVMLVQLYLQSIKKGNLPAIREVFDRIEGRARQTVQIEGEVQVNVQDARARLLKKLTEEDDTDA